MKKMNLKDRLNLQEGELNWCGNAEDVMNRKVESISPNASVLDAIEKLVDNRIRSLVVEPDPEKDVDYGVVTFRDIILRCLSEGLEPKDLEVKEIATTPVVYVTRDMGVGGVVKVMKENNLSRVFVKEKDRIVGVIAPLDIVATCLSGEF
ncbi:MAG: CBS domain-containing protein [Archaeoglobaceae archaeon]